MIEFWDMLGLALTYIFATCAFFLFLYFINKLLQIRKTSRELLPFLGLMFFFLFTSIAFIIVSWFDYYKWEYNIIIVEFFKLYTIFLISSIAAALFLGEHVYKKSKYLGTIYMVIGIFISAFLIRIEDLQFYPTFFFGPGFLLGLLIYYIVFIKPTSGNLRHRMILSVLGLLFIAIGIEFRNDFITQLLGLYIFSIGTIIAIIGWCLIGYGFIAFSTFTDLRWKEKLREIFVIAPNGVCLYAFSFEQNVPLEDSQLIAGGFSGIQKLLSEMVKPSESLQLIEYQDVKIMVEQSVDMMFVLIINEESTFLQYKLRHFSEEFQIFFKDMLKNWFDTEVFKPTKAIIQRIFEVNV